MFIKLKNYVDLFNSLLEINNDNPFWISNKKNSSVPISNKYFLTLFDNSKDETNKFFNYINDDTRSLDFPFEKKNGIDYSFLIEEEQFYQIDINNSFLSEISKNLDEFFKIVNESCGDVIFVLDIKILIDFELKNKNNGNPNHLIDSIIWKLKKNKIFGCIIIDTNEIIKNDSNMFYIQLETCLKNFNSSKYNLEKTIIVYRNINDSVIESVYWNILLPEIKISNFIDKIKSPYDDSFFDIVQIGKKKCFVYEIKLKDCISKNLLDLEKNYGIIIEPIDRLNIFI